MIDLNKIRSLTILEEFKQDLKEFITHNRADLIDVYKSLGFGEEDLDADIESATDLLVKVEKRLVSLGRHLAMEKNALQLSSPSNISSPASSPAS